MSNINNQDWKPVVVNNSQKKKVQQKQLEHNFKLMVSLNEASESDIIKKISENDRKLIIEQRIIKKISQENLAKRLSIKKEIIRDIENGSHNEDKTLTSRIIRFLNSLPIPQS
jgi:ribosome-binding protein aMBF1 (putative translation factor)